ncbi:hypothetical protein [Candidatus Phytoplasma ziziphi]|uniref:hypothetical protein n=1 Tax=Ziziphus jujuba witches'-broom phytoplasma TaxID=135727 RepID=UPI001EDE5340|nr:hypothetical protein [Candidatus Phytoplasma ziziphi]
MFKLTKPIFKIIIIFLFTILLCFIFAYLLYSVFAVSYFRYEIETPIKLLDGRIQKELADQPKMKRTDIYLNSKDDISKIMKYLGYPDKNIYPRPNQNPSYNPSTSDAGQFCLSSIFKDPPNDLLGVYLKKRDNNPLGTTELFPFFKQI